MQIRSGTIIQGRYELLAEIGRGGMGAVWRARQLELDTDVALKLMDPMSATGSQAIERFRQEARAAAALRSPSVIRVFDFGVDEQTRVPFIAMELLQGESLRALLARRGTASPGETALWVSQIGSALTLAHQRGIVHRDLKPENVFLAWEGEGSSSAIAKVLDFGVAKSRSATMKTATGAVLGTFPYMSPEQIDGRSVDHRSDLWSLGVLGCECLTGERPFRGETPTQVGLAIALRRCALPSTVAPVPRGFDEWFARATAIDPDDRFQSATELAREFGELSRQPVVWSAGAPPALASTSPHPDSTLAPIASSPRDPSPPEPKTRSTPGGSHSPLAIPSAAASVARPGSRLARGGAAAITTLLLAGFGAWMLGWSRGREPSAASEAAPVASDRTEKAIASRESVRTEKLNLEAYDLVRLAGQRHFEDRARLLQRAVEIAPTYARGWLALGSHLSDAYQWNSNHSKAVLERAVAAMDRALALAPGDPEVRMTRGWFYGATQKDWPRAQIEIAQVAHDFPNSGQARYMLSRVSDRMGRSAEALEHLAIALSLDPANNDYRYWTALDNAFLRRYEEARAALKNVRVHPNELFFGPGRLRYELARLEFQRTGDTSGLKGFENNTLTDDERRDPKVRTTLLDAAWEVGDAERFVELVRPALEADSGPFFADRRRNRLRAAMAHLDLGEGGEARSLLDGLAEELRESLRSEPENVILFELLALALALRGEHRSAREAIERALSLAPVEADAFLGLQLRAKHARVLAWVGDRAGAVRELSWLSSRPFPDLGHWDYIPIHVEHLRVGLDWAPLRGLPAFERLLKDPANKQPL